MGKFDSLSKTKVSKRKYQYDYSKIYKKGRFATSVDYHYFENAYVQDLFFHCKKREYNGNLLTLWGTLDMRSYIDYQFGNTVNLYFLDSFKRISVNKLEDYNYMHEDARGMKLLDIKYTKHLILENIKLANLYLATFEILDKNNYFRPYVLLFIKNEQEGFEEIGYGYDSNDNGNVELFINNFNYPIFLNKKGQIVLPLSNKKIKFDVYDYITDIDIQKIMS